jgi:hypothetical protein
MLSSVAAFVKFSILASVAAIFLIAALALAFSVVSRALSYGVVQIGKIADLNDATKDRAPYLLARAQELAKPMPLDALYEVRVPPLTTRFGLKDDLKFLDDVKISIQGINLPETIRNLFAALPDDRPIVTAAPEPATTGSAARFEWKDPSGEKQSWLLQSSLPATDAKATRDIIDQAIYAIVYYMHYDPKGPGFPPRGVQFSSARALEAYYAGQQQLGLYQRKRQTSALDEAEQHFRALYEEMPNFTDGLMLLGVTLLEKKSETEAIVIFERIRENLLKDEKDETKLGSNEKKALYSAMLFRATAQRKLYRVEDNHDALRGIEDINKKLAELHKPGGQPEKPEQKADRLDFLKIHISALAEQAYVLGAYLILLNEVNFIEGVTKPPVDAPASRKKDPPGAVALSDDQVKELAAILDEDIKVAREAAERAKKKAVALSDNQAAQPAVIDKDINAAGEAAEQEKKKALAVSKELAIIDQDINAAGEAIERVKKKAGGLTDSQTAEVAAIDQDIKEAREAAARAKKKRFTVYRVALKKIYEAHAGAVKEAEKLIKDETSNDDAWKRARERFLSDLNNAAGYSQHRYAQAVVDDDDTFRTQCKEALAKLNQAYAVHQNEQTIILNLGLIHGDPRCDPSGENIERARRYLEEAIAIKSSDFYAHQLLATLNIRHAYVWGPVFTKPEIVTQAVTAADNARTLRPEGGTIFALLAQAYILQWAQGDDGKRAQVRPLIEASIAQAAKRNATPIHLHTVNLQWLLYQAVKSSDDQFTKEFKPKLETELRAAVYDATGNHTWYGRQLFKDAAALEKMLSEWGPGKQATLHCPG